ncbi:MAG TPA: hypothetical protein VE133_10750 [Candidatus Sulfotelmatobacter sp.]|nr:hypothetical protein [Candidatus Sulfotelmatobacter sp.]
MADKPGDFFVGIIDFFGILVPGAVLLYLQGRLLSDYLGLYYSTDSTVQWVVFAVGSYVAGHFVMGISVVLNRFHGLFYSEAKDPFYSEAEKSISLPANVPHNRTNVFYRAFAFVRLKGPSALAEIERQMAEYKMFRSLTLVFALDFAIQAAINSTWWFRVALSLLLSLAAARRFLYLLNWTRRITFEYYALLHSGGSEGQQDKKDPLIE